MAISENDPMWKVDVPIERENGPVAPEVSPPQAAELSEDLTVNDGAAVEVVPPMDATARLEATLARLEMSSLEMKLYLDSIEQRISRIEPYLQALPRPADLSAGATEAVRNQSQPEVAVVSGESFEAMPVSADGTPRPGRRATRWAQMLQSQPEFGAGELGPSGGGSPASATEVGAVEEPLAQVRKTVEEVRTVPEEVEADRVPEPLAAVPSPRRSGSPEWLAAEDARRTRGTMDDSMDGAREVRGDTREPESSPRMWRGYRVSQLLLGLVLLVLGVIPAAIWWRVSAGGRPADAPETTELSDGGIAGSAGSAGGNAGAGQSGVSATPEQGRSGPGNGPKQARSGAAEGERRPGDAELGTVSEDLKVAGTASAPITRRQPGMPGSTGADRGAAAAGTAAGASGVGSPSTVAGADLAREGVDGGGDVVGGTSARRVRVSSQIMAGHLLPTDGSSSGSPSDDPQERGSVEAAVFISNTGRVEDVQVISGQSSLRGPAVRTIRNWRYEPFVQAGVRTPVVTTATVRFEGPR